MLNGVDPLDPKVENWWKRKVEDLVKHIPSFGGEFPGILKCLTTFLLDW